MLDATFEKMRAIIEAPSFELLKHYRDDFFVHDRAFLKSTWGMTERYLWIVREMGTHLVPLGVHGKCHEEAEAALDLGATYASFLVRPGRVSEISKADAILAMKEMQYTTTEDRIFKKGVGHLADFFHTAEWTDGKKLSRVSLTSGKSRLMHGDHLALICIAQCEAVRRTQSLFARTEWITLDGQDLYELSNPQELRKAA